jgi:hypothetical protein
VRVKLRRVMTKRFALVATATVVVLLVLAQLLLPVVAARIARDQLGKYGTVRSVRVRAFPAVELLWGHAQSATVRAGELRMSDSQFDTLLPRMRGIENIDISADSFQLGPWRVRDMQAEKRGEEFELHGRVTQADLQSALPAGVAATVVGSADGGVEVRVGGSLFGVGASITARLSAQEGKLVVQPQGLPFAGFARITLFSDPRLAVQSFDLSGASAGQSEESYALTLRAKLR